MTDESQTLPGPTTAFTVTQKAASRIGVLLAKQDAPSFFRISVLAGGCSGFQYNFCVDQASTPDDQHMDAYGVPVVIDETSLGILAGSQLDFEEDLMGAMFVIKNPNATSRCGCGNSFSVF
jgi:iron-sulfur cluster insertion protein